MIISAQQSRDARRELGLSQAEVAKSIDINRQYLSEYETGFSKRLTDGQLKKLRSFYESEIHKANESGEKISITFGNQSEPSLIKENPLPISQITLAISHLAIDDKLSEDQIKQIIQKIVENDDAAAELMTEQAQSGFLNDWHENTDATLKELFGRFAENYVLIRHLQGRHVLTIDEQASITPIKTVGDLFKSLFKEDNASILPYLTTPKEQESDEVTA